MRQLPRQTAPHQLQAQRLPELQRQTDQQKQPVYPPQANVHGDLALVQRAASGNQQGQVSHIKQNGWQQFEEAALPWIYPRQRHRQQRDHKHQQRNRHTPLQLSLLTRLVAANQLAGRQGFTLADIAADFRFNQQYAVGVVFDRAVIGGAGVTG